ncbi:tRNA selenocysteine 1-associated protein 1-like [Nematolebias whitei]|uniref:tRNA selenocysteine 1-associated protein 1-like n=1 Tax=Nematolebias whitei TaxID=451745 RepID=UPI00189AAF40|nr:tRNA selenocysteine 1-associated protein 1-like [Nematolebias whitei]
MRISTSKTGAIVLNRKSWTHRDSLRDRLDPYMGENFVKQAFIAMGESPLGVKIITHRITGCSAGYCFVELADEASVDRCVQRLNGKLVPGLNPPRKFKLNFATFDGKRPEGTVLGGKPLRLSFAVAKSQKTPSYPGVQGQSYHNNYNQTPSNYYGSQGGYYSQWGGYDQYSGYNSGAYGSGYNSGYNSYNSGYGYNYGPYGYPPSGHMVPPPPMGMPPMTANMTGAVATQEQTEDDEDDDEEEPIPECDVELWNKEFMQRSEELYDAMTNSHWEPLDSVDSPIPTSS